RFTVREPVRELVKHGREQMEQTLSTNTFEHEGQRVQLTGEERRYLEHEIAAHETPNRPTATEHLDTLEGLAADAKGAAPEVREREVAPKHYSLKPSDVEQAAQAMKVSGRLEGDMAVFDKLVQQAKAGQAGSLGELEAIQRWIDNGSTVDVLSEHQNQLNASGKTRTNPDYRVDGKLREVKSRSDALDNEWVKENVTKANKQIKNSGLDEQG